MLFFDELQEITGWERYIRQKLDENYNVVLTGSNATLMSRETGTKLTGRHLDRELDGLYEALLFFKIKKGIIVTLNQSDSFIREGMNAAVMPAGEFLRL